MKLLLGRTLLRQRPLRGNAIVEFALTWFPILALLFGLADVSRMVFMRNMMQNAVREGVRYAITYQLNFDNGNCANQTECIKKVVQKNSLGFFTGTVGGQDALNYIKVSYYTPDKLSTPALPSELPKWVNGVKIEYLNQPGNLVEVRVDNYPVNWMVPLPTGYLGGTGLVFSVASSDVLQGLPAGQQAPPAP
jgi:hypothetical protein